MSGKDSVNGKSKNGDSAAATVPTANGSSIDWDAVRRRLSATAESLSELGTMDLEALQTVWAQRAQQVARVPDDEGDDESVELVLMQLGGEVYGVDVQYVADVQRLGRVTSVPRTPEWLRGVANLRGRILSVVDLKKFFNLATVEDDEEKDEKDLYLVVIESPHLDVAFLVDAVLAIESTPSAQVRNADGIVRGLPAEYVRGVVDLGNYGYGDLVVVLDLQILLADHRMIINEEMD